MLQGNATFPGVNQIFEASIDLVHGITPSVATLVVLPQPGFVSLGGTLRFTFGDTVVEFPRCKIDQGSLERNTQGMVWRLAVLDRRWRWKWGTIAGRYNIREGDYSTILDGSEATPQELAEKCLEAMGETNYDVSQLPNDLRPEVDWEYEVPAEALANLCDDLGCRVVLGLDDVVRICRAGQGIELPSGGVMRDSYAIDASEKPDAIGITCGPDRFQFDFELEAVGRDIDGKIKPIDNLTYKPSAGWSVADLPYFTIVTTSLMAREYAKETVFRWYRIKCSSSSPVRLLGGDQITSRRLLLPIETEQVDTVIDFQTGEETRRPALVYGVWWPGLDGLENVVTTVTPDNQASAEYRRSYTIDTEEGIVRFSQPIYRNTEAGTPTKLTIGEAQLRLLAATSIRYPSTDNEFPWAFFRSQWIRQLGGGYGTPTRFVAHPELVVNHSYLYSANYVPQSEITNEDEVADACEYYLDALEDEYNTPTAPQMRQYIGLRPISPDGAIQHVTFSVTRAGTTTTVSRNNEALHRVVPYKQRRFAEKQRKVTRDAG